MSKPHKEAKRLAKSVKRRRLFAEQLRIEARALRAVAQTLDIESAEEETNFADRLDGLANREFATAREEEQAQREASERQKAAFAPRPIDPEQEARAARALGVLSETGSAARVRYMADTFSVGVGINYSPSELMKMIEDLLDREKMDDPANRAGLKFGERINRAEKLFFGKPRF